MRHRICQQYIKKLRRENSQLRREIWNLRDQYDKLECMMRSQDQEQVAAEEDDRYDCNCGVETEERSALSIVPEESENEIADEFCESRHQNEDSDEQTERSPNLHPHEDQIGDVTKQFENLNSTTLAAPMQNDVTQLNANDEDGTTNGADERKMCSLKTCEDIVNVYRKNAGEQKTFIFPTHGIDGLTAEEVIDNLEQQFKNDCHVIIDGVRFTGRHCFLLVKDVDAFRKYIESGFNVREKVVQPEDVWERSSVLLLSAVPHHITDEQIVATISRFADVIGNVKRQTYKGLDTGERFVHIVTPDIIPCQLLLGSICLPVTIVHPRRKSSSIARRKSFRSQININLTTAAEADGEENALSNKSPAPDTTTSASNAFKPEPSSNGISSDLETTNVFQFPNATKSSAQSVSFSKRRQESPPQQQNPNKSSSTGESPSALRRLAQRSVSSFRRHNATCENSRPPSPGATTVPVPSTPRIFRRSSVNFRNGSADFGRSRPMDLYSGEYGSGYARERSASDASSRLSICKRKLSVTPHDNSSKIPWCGCWGIGCC